MNSRQTLSRADGQNPAIKFCIWAGGKTRGVPESQSKLVTAQKASAWDQNTPKLRSKWLPSQ